MKHNLILAVALRIFKMKKVLVMFGIVGLLVVFSMGVFASDTSAVSSSTTFNFNHVWSINPVGTLLGFGGVSYNSEGQALNASVSLFGIPILTQNFMFLQPLKLNSINAYWDTMIFLGFIPLELGVGAQAIMSSGFFVGGDLDLTILLLPWFNLYAGIYY